MLASVRNTRSGNGQKTGKYLFQYKTFECNLERETNLKTVRKLGEKVLSERSESSRKKMVINIGNKKRVSQIAAQIQTEFFYHRCDTSSVLL